MIVPETECPPGLFLYKGRIGLKTHNCDMYDLSTGALMAFDEPFSNVEPLPARFMADFISSQAWPINESTGGGGLYVVGDHALGDPVPYGKHPGDVPEWAFVENIQWPNTILDGITKGTPLEDVFGIMAGRVQRQLDMQKQHIKGCRNTANRALGKAGNATRDQARMWPLIYIALVMSALAMLGAIVAVFV